VKVLVTGGSGFIGTNLVEHLLAAGAQVRNVDSNPPLDEQMVEHWVKADIMDADGFAQIVAEFQPDQLIHLAARTDLNGSSLQEYDLNTQGTRNVIAAANGVASLKRLILTSSMLVCRVGYQPDGPRDYTPNTPYGESKVEMENIIYDADIKAEWVIVRPTSIWGPWFREPYRNFFDLVLRGMFVHPGRRACTKTYGFVGNAVHQISRFMSAPSESVHGKCFYLGDDPPIPISDWADEIREQADGRRNHRIPYFCFVILGWMGDLLKLVKLRFPMTSFRLGNMTTDHVLDLRDTLEVAGASPHARAEGVRTTLNWLRDSSPS
jgi:GlcNAc-P-P-Und epimerase